MQSGCQLNEVTKMGLFDVFSKGGKYFGKAIEPKCEYCEFGKRTKDGDKVLCTKKGLVDASFHCPKFIYSPLKRIPVKQMNMVGFLEGDYDEKSDDDAKPEEKPASKKAGSAPAPEKKEAKPAPAAPVSEPESAPAAPVNDLAALAAAADAAGGYAPDAADAAQAAASGLADM